MNQSRRKTLALTAAFCLTAGTLLALAVYTIRTKDSGAQQEKDAETDAMAEELSREMDAEDIPL